MSFVFAAVRRNSQQFAAKFLELRSSGKPCNFWQYNSQARGPKGRRIYGEITLKDCHVLDEFSDPVSHGESGIGQPNKLRHGEGNDPRPDTQKLMEIGSRISRLEEEFRGLSAVKSGLTKGDEVGRQKNKLASRICRLKKKAQHEANKVKLEGLREEHGKSIIIVVIIVINDYLNVYKVPRLHLELKFRLEVFLLRYSFGFVSLSIVFGLGLNLMEINSL